MFGRFLYNDATFSNSRVKGFFLCVKVTYIYTVESEDRNSVESAKVRIKREGKKDEYIMGGFFLQLEDMHGFFLCPMTSLSKIYTILLIGNFNYPNIYWQPNFAKAQQIIALS